MSIDPVTFIIASSFIQFVSSITFVLFWYVNREYYRELYLWAFGLFLLSLSDLLIVQPWLGKVEYGSMFVSVLHVAGLVVILDGIIRFERETNYVNINYLLIPFSIIVEYIFFPKDILHGPVDLLVVFIVSSQIIYKFYIKSRKGSKEIRYVNYFNIVAFSGLILLVFWNWYDIYLEKNFRGFIYNSKSYAILHGIMHIYWAIASLICLTLTISSQLIEISKKNSKKLKDAQRIARMGNWEMNIDDGSMTWSQEIYKIFGKQAEMFKPNYEKFLSLVHPEDREQISQILTKIKMGYQIYFEFVSRISVKKHIRYVKVFGELDRRESENTVMGTVIDITEIKKSEIELLKTYSLLEQTSEAAQIGTWEVKISSGNIVWSPVARKIFEVNDERSMKLDETIEFIKEGSCQKSFQESIHLAVNEGESFDIELEMSTARGNDKWLRSIGIPVKEGKKIGRIYGLFQDITSIKKTEEMLLQARETAEVANRAKSVFLTNMSHELRTPLNAIQGFAQILEYEENLNDKQKDYVRTIIRSGDTLLTLINDVLDMARIESGNLELNKENFSIHDCMESIREVIEERARKKGLSLLIEIEDGISDFVYGDKRRLQQILYNLLSNAVKFTGNGTIILRIYGKNDLTCFEVEDTGIGISEKNLKRIFEPFQITNEKILKTEGSGLGLPISQKLASLMSSQILVKSHLNKGSRFWLDINLPAAKITTEDYLREESKHIIGYKWRENNSGGHAKDEKIKMLVLDDVELNRILIKNYLSRLGMEVIEGGDGKKGLEMTMKYRPHLILLDLIMPVMGGFEMVRKLRETREIAHVPVIALSGNASVNTKEVCIESGCNGYVPKPFRFDELLDSIGEQLEIEWVYSGNNIVEEKKNSDESEQIIFPQNSMLEELSNIVRLRNLTGLENYVIDLKRSESDELNGFVELLEQHMKRLDFESIEKILIKHDTSMRQFLQWGIEEYFENTTGR